MKIIFFLSILAFNPLYAETKTSSTKTATLMKKGHVFDHYEIQDDCRPKDLCEKEGPSICQSQKAKYLRCSEQYKENWIITCICL